MNILRRTILALVIGFSLLAGFSACNNNTLLRIQTDIPELALLADRYQAAAGNPSILIEFQTEVGTAFPNGSAPDLVIGRGLYNHIHHVYGFRFHHYGK